MLNDVNFANEHDEVVWYVLKRELVRPEITYIKALYKLLKILFINALILLVAYYLLTFALTSFFIVKINEKVLLFIIILIIVLADTYFYGDKAAIVLIKLYQHYAPEHIRRKCLFKPTCSEYAILAIDKYGLIIAIPKIYNRIFKRCVGKEYKIDYP